jgi:hypothetical protein
MLQGKVAGGEMSPWADWTVEGCEHLDEKGHHHKNAFYTLLKHYFDSRDYFGSLRSKREEIIADLLDEMNLTNMSRKFLQWIGQRQG